MSDHDYVNDYFEEEADIFFSGCPENISSNVKTGDELLIELYRERQFLYDKTNKHFKDRLMKNNAWVEISTIMIEVCKDNMYTAKYCQKRCTNLRDQFVKEKKKVEAECKSGNGVIKRDRFPLFKQISFLDCCIIRRSTYSNCISRKNIENSSSNNIQNNDDRNEGSSTHSENEENVRSNENTAYDRNGNKENNIRPVIKKKKLNETKELEQTIIQLSQRISNFVERNPSDADDSFFDFLRAKFNDIPDKDKDIRRKLLLESLTSTLN